jgi:integrase
MNELRLIKISDVDVNRKCIHIRQGKGKKDRYVVLSKLLADRFFCKLWIVGWLVWLANVYDC